MRNDMHEAAGDHEVMGGAEEQRVLRIVRSALRSSPPAVRFILQPESKS